MFFFHIQRVHLFKTSAVTHPIATGHALVYSSIHSSEANFALGLLLDSCGCSCPFRLQAVDKGGEVLRKTLSFSF